MMIWTRPGLPTVRRRMDYHAVDTGRPAADAFRDEPGGPARSKSAAPPRKGRVEGSSRRSNGRAPRNAEGRKVRSKIR